MASEPPTTAFVQGAGETNGDGDKDFAFSGEGGNTQSCFCPKPSTLFSIEKCLVSATDAHSIGGANEELDKEER